MSISCYVTQTGVYIYLQITCEINKTLLTWYFMALFITLGLISRPSAKMLSLLSMQIMLSIYQCMLSAVLYLLRKPLLIRSTAFICNIDRDWMIYRKHPIRSLLTSMLRKANIRYPSDVYALSFEKYKGNFSKTKMYS